MVNGDRRVTPCSPGDPDAVEMTWENVNSDELMEPEVELKDFKKAISATRPTVSKDDLAKNADWTQQFGTEGD